MVDKARARRPSSRGPGRWRTGCREPARTLMAYVNNRDVAHLGPLLAPHLARSAATRPCRPTAARRRHAAVYLLHGIDDNVIPAIESALLARTLRERGVRVQLPGHAARHPRRGRSRRVGLLGVGAGPVLDRGAARLRSSRSGGVGA